MKYKLHNSCNVLLNDLSIISPVVNIQEHIKCVVKATYGNK
jgi:hypothetical protein